MTPLAQTLVALLAIGATTVSAVPKPGAILHELPSRPDPAARYVIYLHGRIIEDKGPRPTHERWGIYEYQKILETLAAAGLTVISEQRPAGTNMDHFAEHVVSQARALLAAGVPPERLTVMGFSKGGGIAIRASNLLKDDRVNFVFLAACGDGDFHGSSLDVRGRILSIYEASDEAGRSCAQLFALSKGTGKRSEVRIDTGEEQTDKYSVRGASAYRQHQKQHVLASTGSRPRLFLKLQEAQSPGQESRRCLQESSRPAQES